MMLATFSTDRSPRPGVIANDGVYEVSRLADAPSGMTDLIVRWPELRARLEGLIAGPPDHSLKAVKLHAPIARPGKIFAIGLNYADHCAESGLEVPKEQIWFSKAVTAVNGPFDPIELPAVSEQLDFECEMVAVIGRRCRNVARASARDVIFGYCAGNDVSVRDWQLRTGQWVLGKSFDTHAPFGPWITTADRIDPQSLDIRCIVNGEVRQKSNTRHMVFDVYAQVEQLSKVVTLEPGDLIFTGTCGGVAISEKPPRWLKAGDIVRVEIDKLGAIENRVERGSALQAIS